MTLHLPEKPGTESVNRKIPAGFPRFPFYEYLYSYRFLIHGLNVSHCHSALLADSSQLTAYSSQLTADS